MPFPDAKRVIYEKNPLEGVICQLRFPPILKIDTESPSTFQEKIRAEYPFYTTRPAFLLPPGMPAELAAQIAAGQSMHEFKSRDERWTVALNREFITLNCRSYDRWENFKEHLHVPFDALQAVYAPAFLTRIGLRYRDVIRRSVLDLQNVGWAELLSNWVAGPLAAPGIASDVEHSAQEAVLRLSDGVSRLRVQHGLALDGASQEQCYVIDADFFLEQQTECSHVVEHLNFLNRQSRLFFRSSICEPLHLAMRPRQFSDD
jgi:uncharacterized protein (TIGR04255 family)